MTVNPNRHMTARERQKEAIRKRILDRDEPGRGHGRQTRPRGNQEAEPRDVERGVEKLDRVIGH